MAMGSGNGNYPNLVAEIGTSPGRGEFWLDLIAALAMSGALLPGEYFARIIIAMMFAGGEALGNFAKRRAHHELTALLDRVPRMAARFTGKQFEEVVIEEIEPGDRILVRSGEVLPVDGRLQAAQQYSTSRFSQARHLPLLHRSGEYLMRGSINPGNPFEMVASRVANESTYAGIARLVEAAKTAKAPMSPGGPLRAWLSHSDASSCGDRLDAFGTSYKGTCSRRPPASYSRNSGRPHLGCVSLCEPKKVMVVAAMQAHPSNCCG